MTKFAEILKQFVLFYIAGALFCIIGVAIVQFSNSPLLDTSFHHFFMYYSEYRELIDSIASPAGISGWFLTNILLTLAVFLTIYFSSDVPISSFNKAKDFAKKLTIFMLAIASFISSFHFTFVQTEEYVLSKEVKSVERANLKLEAKLEGLKFLKDNFVTNKTPIEQLELISSFVYMAEALRSLKVDSQNAIFPYQQDKEYRQTVSGTVWRLMINQGYEFYSKSSEEIKPSIKSRLSKLQIQSQSAEESTSSASNITLKSKSNEHLEKAIEEGVSSLIKELVTESLGVGSYKGEVKFFVDEFLSEMSNRLYRNIIVKTKDKIVDTSAQREEQKQLSRLQIKNLHSGTVYYHQRSIKDEVLSRYILIEAEKNNRELSTQELEELQRDFSVSSKPEALVGFHKLPIYFRKVLGSLKSEVEFANRPYRKPSTKELIERIKRERRIKNLARRGR